MITPFDDNYKRMQVIISDLDDKQFINIGDADTNSIEIILESTNITYQDYRVVIIDESNIDLYENSSLDDVIVDWSDYLGDSYILKDLIDSGLYSQFDIMYILNQSE